MLLDVDLPPGVFANGTARQSKGRWRDSNLIRWLEGRSLQPVGGWLKRSASAVTGKARAIQTWRENTSTRWIGIGTNSKLYVMSASAAISDITPAGFTAGAADASTGGGYGAGAYGVGAYGTPRPDTSTVTPAAVWTLDTWGQYLVGAMSGDGDLYEWQLNTAVVAAQIAGSPTSCDGLVVTAEGFIMALKKRTVLWCDQGDNTTWTAAAGNQAGDQDLDTFGTFQCGRRVSGATLLFTDVDVWRAVYQGPPTVYGFERAGSDCGIVGKGAAVSLDTRCVWMGREGFFLYDGFVRALPCDVADHVFHDFNLLQGSKVTAWHNSQHSEIWWHYPSGESTENDLYVKWNYQQGFWDVGTLERTAGVGPGVFQYPICCDASGYVYEHEQGWDWDDAVPFARTGPLDWPGPLGGSEKRLMVLGFVGDEDVLGDAEVAFYGREYPNAEETMFGPYAITAARTDLLFTTRLLEMEIDFVSPSHSHAGIFQLDIKPVSSR